MLSSQQTTTTETTDQAIDRMMAQVIAEAGNAPMSPALEAQIAELQNVVLVKRRQVSSLLNSLNDARRELGQAQFRLRKIGG